VALVPKYLDDGNIGPQLTLLRSNSKKIVPSFLYWILQSNFIKQQIISNDAGSAMNFFGLERTSRFKLILPTLKEQQKITSVLSNVDSLILSYDGIIKFTTKLKKGMMQQLFVQGIGCRKFKIIKWFFGKKIKIPKTWNIFSIHDSHIKIIDGDRGNEYPKVNDFSTSDYCLFLSAKNVTIGGFVFDTCSFISQQKDKKLRKGKLSRGDIIITTRGTVGNIAYFDESVPYDAIRINSGMAILRNFNELIAQKFLYYLLKSPIVVKQLQFLTYGSVQSQLTIALIDSLKIILPSTIEEQHRIISKLDTINSQISDLKFKKNILENIKKGLMQKLLTGQIRVEINETN